MVRAMVPRTADQSRIPALDGLRGIAIIGILITHSSLAWHLTSSNLPIEQFWYLLMSGGRFGVELFFVLSAFLITGILLKAKDSNSGLRSFYGRRALRILPLYYLVLLIVLPWQAPGAIAGWEPWYWLNVSNWAMAQGVTTTTGYNVFWSLAVEEQFYAIWPLIVLALPMRRLLQVAAIGAVGALAFRSGFLLSGVPTDTVYFATPSHFDSLGIGACLAILAQRPQVLARFTVVARWALLGSAATLGLLVAQLGGFPGDRWVVATIGTSAFAVFFGATLVLALAPQGIVRRVGEIGVLQTFGRYSYCLYLIHVPVGATVRIIAYGALWDVLAPLGPLGHLAVWVMVLGVSLAIAWLSWRYVETPLLTLKRFLPYDSDHARHHLQPSAHQAI